MKSVNYPVYHSVNAGEYNIYINDCGENEEESGDIVSYANSIKFINNQFVAVANSGIIFTSDGITWRGRISDSNPIFKGLNYNSRNIDLAEFAKYVINTDSVPYPQSGELSYDIRSSLIGANKAVQFINGQFICADNTGNILTSPDGLYWKLNYIAETTGISDIVYANGHYFFPAFRSTLIISDDLQTFEEIVIADGSRYIYTIAYGNNIYVAGSDQGYIITSTDLINWNQIQLSILGSYIINQIIFDGTQFIGATFGGVIVSTDGVNWELRYRRTSGTSRYYLVALKDNIYSFVGGGGDNYLTTNDLVNFNEIEQPSTAYVNKLRVINDRFYYVADTRVGFYSEDGETFTSLVLELGVSTPSLRDIAYGNNKYLIVTNNPSTYTSIDGLNFQYNIANSFNDVEYLNGEYIITGSSGYIITSPDGNEWTQVNTPYTYSFQYIAYGNDTYVVSYNNNYTLATTDFQTGQYTQFSGETIRDIKFGNGVFVVVLRDVNVSSSPNGVNWTNSVLPSAVNSVAFGNGLFVLSGAGYTSFYSEDGENWSQSELNTQSIGTTNNVQYLLNNTFAIVGDNGLICLSTDGINWDVSQFTDYSFTTIGFRNDTYYLTATGIGLIATKNFSDFEIITQRTFRAMYLDDNVGLFIGQYQFAVLNEIFDSITIDSDLVKNLYIDNTPGEYIFAYDYNTRYTSELGQSRLNNIPITGEIFPAQIISLSAYDEVCEQQKTINLYVNDALETTSTTDYRSIQYYYNTLYAELNKGDKVRIDIDIAGTLYSVEYTVVDRCGRRYVVYYLNKYGGIDHLIVKGQSIEEYNNDSFQINGLYDRSLPSNFQYRTIQNTARRTWQFNTGKLTDYQSELMDNLLLSPKVWVYDVEEGFYLAANIGTSNFSIGKFENGRTWADYTFTVIQSQDIIRRG